MNLKKYQEDILNEDLDAYLSALDESNDIIKASNNGFVGGELGEMLKQNGIQPQYQQEIANLKIAFVCSPMIGEKRYLPPLSFSW